MMWQIVPIYNWDNLLFYCINEGNRLQIENLCYNNVYDLSIRKGQMREWHVDGNGMPFRRGVAAGSGRPLRTLAARGDWRGFARGGRPVGSDFPAIFYQRSFSNANGRKEIGLNELLTAENNIGKIFNFDSITMLDVLHAAERTGELKIIRTAGLDVINLTHSYTFEECVEQYYEDIEKVE